MRICELERDGRQAGSACRLATGTGPASFANGIGHQQGHCLRGLDTAQLVGSAPSIMGQIQKARKVGCMSLGLRFLREEMASAFGRKALIGERAVFIAYRGRFLPFGWIRRLIPSSVSAVLVLGIARCPSRLSEAVASIFQKYYGYHPVCHCVCRWIRGRGGQNRSERNNQNDKAE